jgi:hypothetical protein
MRVKSMSEPSVVSGCRAPQRGRDQWSRKDAAYGTAQSIRMPVSSTLNVLYSTLDIQAADSSKSRRLFYGQKFSTFFRKQLDIFRAPCGRAPAGWTF